MKTPRSEVFLVALLAFIPGRQLLAADTLHVGAGQTYATIQSAVNAAASGNVILVHDGTYVENVLVDRPLLTIVSADFLYNGRNEGAVVDARGSSTRHGIDIRSSWVSVKGLSVFGATGYTSGGDYTAAICLDSCVESSVSYNRCGWAEGFNNNVGIFVLRGSGNSVLQNSAARNINGIMVSESRCNIVSGNTATGGTAGILLIGSYDASVMDATTTGNTIGANTFRQNSVGIDVESSCWNNSVASNLVDSNSVGVWFSGDCRNNHISGNVVRNNATRGIHVNHSSDFAISYNIVDDNATGIWLGYSSPSDYGARNCEVFGNSITNNSGNGIRISYHSSGNRICRNAFAGNGVNVYSMGTTWESAAQLSYFRGSNWKNHLGNFYSTYTGADLNGDGIGDTGLPFSDGDTLYGPREYYPLMAAPETYDVQAWYLGGDSTRTMFRGNDRKAPGLVEIEPSSSVVWTSDTQAKTEATFPNAPWNGKMRCVETLPAGALEVTIGSSSGSGDFVPSAAVAAVGGSTDVPFATGAAVVTVSAGHYLALRVANTQTTKYTVVTGGSFSYCSGTGMGDPFWPGTTSIGAPESPGPRGFLLLNAFPNPFNPTTVIRYQVPVVSDVRLAVYDILGREVAVLVNEKKAPASYEVRFDGSGFSSGVYLYRLTAERHAESRRMLLLK